VETRTQTSVAEPRRKDAQNEALREVDARALDEPNLRADSFRPLIERRREAPAESEAHVRAGEASTEPVAPR